MSLTIEVRDNCPSGPIPVPNATVNLVVEQGGGRVVPETGTTDGSGKLVATLYLGNEPGMNLVHVYVSGGTNPDGTAMVKGTTPSKATLYLSKNSFDPRKEQVEVQVIVPSPGQVSVRVFNVAGELVRDMKLGVGPGVNVLGWDGHNQRGEFVANGVYLIQVVSGRDVTTKRVIVLKR